MITWPTRYRTSIAGYVKQQKSKTKDKYYKTNKKNNTNNLKKDSFHQSELYVQAINSTLSPVSMHRHCH